MRRKRLLRKSDLGFVILELYFRAQKGMFGVNV